MHFDCIFGLDKMSIFYVLILLSMQSLQLFESLHVPLVFNKLIGLSLFMTNSVGLI